MNSMHKCPICGGELDYHNEVPCDDYWNYKNWQCKNCHATGVGNFEVTFRGHTAIKDSNGNN